MMVPLSIYIHWPFCKSKCPYCDFNSHVRDLVEHERWKAALLGELAYYAQLLPGRRVMSVFFGGGTPSLMEPGTVGALLDAIQRHWSIDNNVEITLEANPTSVEAGKFRAFREAGVNRVSLGIQALEPEALTFLGREHDVKEALAAIELSAAVFPRRSFDLIYARPGQSVAAWERELSRALEFAADHLSLYQLTIEENTAFHHRYHKGAFVMPEDTLSAEMYEATQSLMESHGMPAYEISNHAIPGAESRHNLAYWRSDDYIGVGPGAHGRYRLEGEVYATDAVKSPERWLEQVERAGQGQNGCLRLTPRERQEEQVLMGLRLRGGIEFADWTARTGVELRPALSASALEKLAAQGLIEADEFRIRATPRGRLLLNAVIGALLLEY